MKVCTRTQLLDGFELIKGDLIEKKGWAIRITHVSEERATVWLGKVIDCLSTRLTLLEIVGQPQFIEQLEKLYQIEIDVTRLQQQYGALAANVSDLSHKLDNADNRINAVEQAYRYEGMSEPHLLAVKQQAKTIIQNRYMAKQVIQGLFGRPFQLQGQYINVQMLYQNQVSEKRASGENAEEKDKKAGLKLFQDVRVTSFEDIFGQKMAIEISQLLLPAKQLLKEDQKSNETNPHEPPRLLLIQGRAGIGKTTFVEYVAREWGAGRLWLELNWLFVLRLRDLREVHFLKAFEQGKVYGLSDWVYHTHFAATLSEIDFKTLWQREIEPELMQGKILFVLDGYDETPEQHACQHALQDLLDRRIPTFITSRPYGVSNLPATRRDLEVVGFVDENVEKYVKYYFGEAQAEKAEQILKGLHNNSALWGNAHIPVTLNVMCGVLQPSENLTIALEELSTFSGLYGQMELKLLERAYRKNKEAEWNDTRKNLLAKKQRQFLEKFYAKHREVLSRLAYNALEFQQLVMSPEALSLALEQSGISYPYGQTHLYLTPALL